MELESEQTPDSVELRWAQDRLDIAGRTHLRLPQKCIWKKNFNLPPPVKCRVQLAAKQVLPANRLLHRDGNGSRDSYRARAAAAAAGDCECVIAGWRSGVRMTAASTTTAAATSAGAQN